MTLDHGDDFETPEPDWRRGHEPEQLSLFLSLDGYEGPIDVLLSLARQQKVDLTQVSILELAEQYLEFMREIQTLNLEVAADYLVMAAWLAYLKSRLLLPDDEPDDEVMSSDEMAEALRFQLQRLTAMRNAGEQLMARPRLGVEVFPRGMTEAITDHLRPYYDLSLFELLQAYVEHRSRGVNDRLYIAPTDLYAVGEAVDRLRRMLGHIPTWQSLVSFLPKNLREGLMTRSAIASTLAASLELVKEGQVELLQNDRFGPIYLRARPRDER